MEHATKLIFYIMGWTSVLLGVIGLFLPIFPTVPFVLFAAFCFARSCPRAERWLLESRWFGPLIRDWREHRVIRLRAKLLGSLMLILGLCSSLAFLSVQLWIELLVAAPMLIALFAIWCFPSRPCVRIPQNRSQERHV